MAKNTILLKDYSKVYEEYIAGGTITPGMLVELASTGKVQAHSGAGQNVLPMIATEDELQGETIDDNYSADAQTQCWIPGRGDEGYLILKDGEDVAIGDFLESGGDGTVVKHNADGSDATIYSNQIIGVAVEAVDLSASSGAEESGALGYNKRIMVKFV